MKTHFTWYADTYQSSRRHIIEYLHGLLQVALQTQNNILWDVFFGIVMTLFYIEVESSLKYVLRNSQYLVHRDPCCDS